ncbi:MAG TPA: hypothetical protein VFM46_10350, partial [Pseudomonadales bacterium]|nr:hypothetical protein [Pseudomonadales bacterium]
MKKLLLVTAISAAVSAHAADFGQKVEALAKAQAMSLFGTVGTLSASSTAQLTAAQINADPKSLLTVAPGLSVKVVSADASLGANIDQMVLWPNDTNPTHIIACNEMSSGQVAVQRINMATGVPENIISSGLTSCDPVRATPWGTILVGEEAGTNGRLFEILDPLTTTNVTITGSGTSTVSSDNSRVRYLPAVGQLSFEGLALYPNGVLYYSDEQRPGSGTAGGSIFKFIPNTLWTAGSPAITSLDNSPLSAGRIFGFRVGRNSNNTDFGQGNEYGRGVWVEVTGTAPVNLRATAVANKLTGYYRPEDMDIDLKALAAGNVRFCGTDTGQDIPSSTSNGDNAWGEVYCIT